MLQFKANKVYQVRSICDSECFFSYVVLKRTAKTLTILNQFGEEVNRRVKVVDGVEHCKIDHYSMAPTIRADRGIIS